MIPDPPIAIAGDYDITVTTTVDTCDVGSGTVMTPMLVDEIDAVMAEVDLPIGGAGGACDRQDFLRTCDTLTRAESMDTQIGPCPVRVDVTTVLDFFDDDTVSGTEINELTTLNAQACAGVFSDCTVELDIAGARCTGCFSCVEMTSTSTPGPWGAFAVAAGARIAPGEAPPAVW